MDMMNEVLYTKLQNQYWPLFFMTGRQVILGGALPNV